MFLIHYTYKVSNLIVKLGLVEFHFTLGLGVIKSCSADRPTLPNS